MHRTGSKSASIRVAREADEIIVEIQDQSCGMPQKSWPRFSPKAPESQSGESERLRHFGGELVVESNGTGTKIVSTLPSKALPAESRVVAGQQREIA